MAQLLVGADPVPWPGGFVASAASRARPGDDPSPPGGLRSTAQFRWPVYAPRMEAVGPCGEEVVPSFGDQQTNKLWDHGPERPVITVATQVECSTFTQLPEAEWEAAVLDQHNRQASAYVAYLAWNKDAQVTDAKGNKTANLFADAFVLNQQGGLYPDVLSRSVIALRIAGQTMTGGLNTDLGMLHIPAGLGEAVSDAGIVNDLTPGALPTVGPNAIPLIEDHGYSIQQFGEPTPETVAIVLAPTHSVRKSAPNVAFPEGGVKDWRQNDAAVMVSQQFVWDWNGTPIGINVEVSDPV